MIPLAIYIDIEAFIGLFCILFLVGCIIAGIIYRIDPTKKRKIEIEKLEADIKSLERELRIIKKQEEDILR